MTWEDKKQPEILRVDVAGKDKALFVRLREKLLLAIEQCLDATLVPETDTTLRSAGIEVLSESLSSLKEHLRAKGVENAEAESRIAEKLAAAEERKANARKTNAEAEAIESETRAKEFDRKLEQLSKTLKLCQAVLVHTEDEATLLLIRDLNAVLEEIGTDDIAGLPGA